MQFLLDYAEERVRPLSEAALSLRGVQGIVLEPDAEWLYWLALNDQVGRNRAERIFDQWGWRLFDEIEYRRSGLIRALLRQNLWKPGLFVPFRPLTLRDLKDLPKYWDNFLQQAGWPEGARDPIVVKVRLRPDIASDERSRLTELPLVNTLRVEFETHPLAVFYASPRASTDPSPGE